MQRSIYDFLYRKYGFLQQGNGSIRSHFTRSIQLYWGVKLIAVAIYFIAFLKWVGMDYYLPSETYWFISGVAGALLLVTLSYLNIFAAWFAIAIGKHRKWIDTLLIVTGLLLSIKLPAFTFGDTDGTWIDNQESLLVLGLLMIVMGVYRKIHYQNLQVVQKSAVVSILITALIFIKFPLDSIGQSIYLGFILLLNIGFMMDLILYYYLHHKFKTQLTMNRV